MIDTLQHPKIQSALSLAEDIYKGKRRKSGEPVIVHVLDIGRIMDASPHKFALDECIAGMLHDSIEDSDLEFNFLDAQYGARVASLVWCLSKPKGMSAYVYYMALREMSPTVIAIKLCDMYANLKTCEACDEQWKRQFKSKIKKWGLPLVDIIMMHGEEWYPHANWLKPKMESHLTDVGDVKEEDLGEYYQPS